MRRITIVALLVLACAQAFALNWRTTTRADHDSLDVVMRRLDYAIAQSNDATVSRELVAIREHLLPVFDRHGGPVAWWEGGRIKLGSDEELELICAQHGYAHTSTDRAERANDIVIGFFRWAWQSIWAIVLGMGPWFFLCVGLYVIYRRQTAEQIATHRVIDNVVPDKDKRGTLFGDDLINRAHQRIKKWL